MSQISQLQIRFIATEDRLLLRVASTALDEFRFWLTARLIKMLYPALLEALGRSPDASLQTSVQAKREVVAFEHERAVSKADFKTTFNEAKPTYPLGDNPILITKCQIKPQADGAIILALAPEQGQGIDLNLNHELLHSFIKLLTDATNSAEWPLPSNDTSKLVAQDEPKFTVN